MLPFFIIKYLVLQYPNELIPYLEQFITPERNRLFDNIIKQRTRYITVVLEDIYQSHNASAVLRTCDCFGIQDVHIIENKNRYTVNPDVSLGSDKWVSIHKYNQQKNNTLTALQNLKQQGYKIVATTPHNTNINLDEFDVEQGKFALVFGTELHGLSNNVMQHADQYLKTPMFGFTESFNISVSAAIIIHYLSNKMRQSNIKWQLTDYEKNKLKLQWLQNTIKKSELIINNFINNR